MTDRRVRVLLDLVASGFQAGVAKAKASTDALIGSLEKNQKALGDVSTAMMGAGAAALAGVGAVVVFLPVKRNVRLQVLNQLHHQKPPE